MRAYACKRSDGGDVGVIEDERGGHIERKNTFHAPSYLQSSERCEPSLCKCGLGLHARANDLGDETLHLMNRRVPIHHESRNWCRQTSNASTRGLYLRRLCLMNSLRSDMFERCSDQLEGFRIPQGRSITNISSLDEPLHDTAHIFSRQRFGNVANNHKLRRNCVFTNVTGTILRKSSQDLLRQVASGHQRDERPGSLSCKLVGHTHDDAVSNRRIRPQLIAQNAGFNLSSSNPMAVNIEHVVRSAMHGKTTDRM